MSILPGYLTVLQEIQFRTVLSCVFFIFNLHQIYRITLIYSLLRRFML